MLLLDSLLWGYFSYEAPQNLKFKLSCLLSVGGLSGHSRQRECQDPRCCSSCCRRCCCWCWRFCYSSAHGAKEARGCSGQFGKYREEAWMVLTSQYLMFAVLYNLNNVRQCNLPRQITHFLYCNWIKMNKNLPKLSLSFYQCQRAYS